MIDGHGGDCSGGDVCVSGGGGGGGDVWDASHPKQPQPIDQRPKINGAPVIDQTHEIVIEEEEPGSAV